MTNKYKRYLPECINIGKQTNQTNKKLFGRQKLQIYIACRKHLIIRTNMSLENLFELDILFRRHNLLSCTEIGHQNPKFVAVS